MPDWTRPDRPVESSADAWHVAREDLAYKADRVRETLYPLASVTAAATRLVGTRDEKARRTARPTTASWQEESWDMLDLVGELHFLLTTLANRIASGALYVGEVEPGKATAEPVETENGDVQAVLAAFGGNQAGRSQLIRRMAMNLLVAGEGWFLGLNEDALNQAVDAEGADVWAASSQPVRLPAGQLPADPTECSWRTLSVSEIAAPAHDRAVELSLEDSTKLIAGLDDVHLIRVWRPHDRRAWEADAASKASLPVLRELVGLTMHVAAQVDSRLAGAGLFIYPQSWQASFKAAAGLPPNSERDPLAESMIEAMVTPIQDRASAAAVVPLMLGVPDETAEMGRHVSFATPLDGEVRELRDEAIRRLALSQDAPPEILLGTGQMNHWGGWLVNEDTVTVHVEPPLALMCDALTTQYLWPALVASGMTQEQAERFVVWYSVDHMVVRPNSFAEALELFERGGIDLDTLRRAAGFDLSDSPGDEGHGDVEADLGSLSPEDARIKATLRALLLVDKSPTLASTPGLPKLVEQLTAVLSLEEYEPEVPAALAPGAEPAGEDEPPAAGELPAGPTTDGPDDDVPNG